MSCLIHVVASSGLQNAQVACLHGTMTGYTHGLSLRLALLGAYGFLCWIPRLPVISKFLEPPSQHKLYLHMARSAIKGLWFCVLNA